MKFLFEFVFILVITLFMSAVPLVSQERYPTRRLTSDNAREAFPSWSPDGKTIVYSTAVFIDGKPVLGLRKIPSGGGESVRYADLPAEHPQWSPDGRLIVFDSDYGSGMKMIKAEGGNPIAFLPDSIGISKGGMPIWSPDGSRIAFLDGSRSLCIHDVKKGTFTKAFSEKGMVPIPGCWAVDGKSVLIALMDSTTRVSTMWNISADRSEKKQITGHRDGFYRYMALSPDGALLVYAAMEEKRLGLWIMPAEGGPSLPLAVSREYNYECPAWSPDGKLLAYASGKTGQGGIYVMEMDIGKIIAELKALNR